MIASQYLGWDYFAYDAYQGLIDATTSPHDLALGVTEEYARLAYADGHPYTIAALNLRRMQTTRSALGRLATELSALIDDGDLPEATLDGIRQASQHFESNGNYVNDQQDMYVDLVDWTRQVQDGVSSPAVQEAAADLLAGLTGPQQPLIMTSKAESNPLPPQYAGGEDIDLSHSNGVSIFYPQGQGSAAFRRYIDNELFNFTSVSHWPDFLVAGRGPLCPGCDEQPLPGPLPPLSQQRAVFLPMVLR